MSSTIQATRIRDGLMRGDATLWRLSEPVEHDGGWSEYVITSAVDDGLVHETYIFLADESGQVIDWGEMPGSERYTTDHEAAIRRAGWVVA